MVRIDSELKCFGQCIKLGQSGVSMLAIRVQRSEVRNMIRCQDGPACLGYRNLADEMDPSSYHVLQMPTPGTGSQDCLSDECFKGCVLGGGPAASMRVPVCF